MASRNAGLIVLGTMLFGAWFFAAASPANAAFGISPPFLNADHLVPGITYTQTIYLVQDQPNVDLPIKATLSVPQEIVSWISIDKGFNFTIPSGARQFPVQVSIHVPSDVTIGKWSGNLAFTSQPIQTGQVAIALGVNVAINLTVGNNIFEQFSVPLITFPDIEEGWNPEVYVKFDNKGNISEAFDAATLEIYDQYDSVRLAYIQKQDGFPATPAFSTNDYTIEFPTNLHLGTGQYWGNVVFYQNGKVVASQKTIFNVLPAGSIAGTWGRIGHFLNANAWVAYVVVLLVIAGIGWFWFRRRRKKPLRRA